MLCKYGKWPIQDFDFSNKNSSIFVLKVRKLDDEVIDLGREFRPDVGTLVKDCKLLQNAIDGR